MFGYDVACTTPCPILSFAKLLRPNYTKNAPVVNEVGKMAAPDASGPHRIRPAMMSGIRRWLIMRSAGPGRASSPSGGSFKQRHFLVDFQRTAHLLRLRVYCGRGRGSRDRRR